MEICGVARLCLGCPLLADLSIGLVPKCPEHGGRHEVTGRASLRHWSGARTALRPDIERLARQSLPTEAPVSSTLMRYFLPASPPLVLRFEAQRSYGVGLSMG
jgi:hypothetical protein